MRELCREPYFFFPAAGAHGCFTAQGLVAQGFFDAFVALGAQGFFAAHGLAAQGLATEAADAK
jgi:hypothetical protein